MKTKVLRADRSPLNKKQWLCELACGHEQWVTATRKPVQAECNAEHRVQADEAVCTAFYHLSLAYKGDTVCGVCHQPLRR